MRAQIFASTLLLWSTASLNAGGSRVAGIMSADQPPVSHREATAAPRSKAIAFDYFVLFNPDSVVPHVERVFPGKGREFTNLWRTRNNFAAH